jgi:hypothetical protein
MKTYTHPQENWNEAECAKRAKYAPADHWGNKPPKGLIARCGSSYPEYGKTVRYNGGKVIKGKLYEAECVPLPIIHPSYEIAILPSWGKVIRKKS